MEFQTTIEHTASNEVGLLTFLNFAKDNYPTQVHQAHADSIGLKCGATLVFVTLADAINAVIAFKTIFQITYRLIVNI